jgi:threonine dehydrogenase-like Zn-dependent dehydrogenase
VNLVGINCHATEADGRTSFDVAAEMLLAHRLSPGDIITHRFPVEQYKRAIRAFLNKPESKAIKIVLDLC